MLSVGLAELVLIAFVVLLVVGPDDLPRLLREVGRRYGQLRRAADDLRRAFVLEADRQDAEERYAKMQARRQEAMEARRKALEEAGEGAVAHDRALPGAEGPDGSGGPSPEDLDIAGFEDPLAPAHRPVAPSTSVEMADDPGRQPPAEET